MRVVAELCRSKRQTGLLVDLLPAHRSKIIVMLFAGRTLLFAWLIVFETIADDLLQNLPSLVATPDLLNLDDGSHLFLVLALQHHPQHSIGVYFVVIIMLHGN